MGVTALALASCGASSDRLTAARARSPASATKLSANGLFSPGSAFNAPLRPDAPLDPTSPRLMAQLRAQVAQEQAAREGPWIQTTTYSTPVYRVPANQPLVPVKLENDRPWARTLRAALRAVPIPPAARPAVGSDAQITIWQPSTDRLWELWKASNGADGWHALWGGAIERVSRSPGYYTRRSWPGASSYWGATATSLPVIAGTMTISELQRGAINHALAIDLPSTRAALYTWPAQRTDGEDPSSAAIPEGAHLRIDPHLSIPRLKLPPLAEQMALAAQRYGMIVRDQTHHAVGFYAEDPTPFGTNPYPALMDYETPAEVLARFPWKHVEVLRMSLRHGTGRPTH